LSDAGIYSHPKALVGSANNEEKISLKSIVNMVKLLEWAIDRDEESPFHEFY